MDVLPLNFKVLQYCGIWYEHPNHLWLIKMVYKCFVVILYFSLTLSELIELMLSNNNVQELTECLFLSLTFLSCCFKIAKFLCSQESLNEVLHCYRVEIFQPRTTSEEQLITNHQSLISNFFIFYVSIALLSGLGMSILPLIQLADNETALPVKTYQPYNTDNLVLHLITYMHQMLCFFIGILINVSMDMMVCGLLILACCQLDLCCERIRLHNKNTLIAVSSNEHIIHHVLIGDAVEKVQSYFIFIATIQFSFSMIVFCTSMYQMPQQKIMSYEFFNTFVYLMGNLYQVFIYCWFGNQLELKSRTVSDAIYESNWIDLTPDKRKIYLFSMIMSQNGLSISYHGQCNLSLKTYVWILKTSYAAFNLLQKTSN